MREGKLRLNSHLENKDKVFIGFLSLFLFLLSLVSWSLFGQATLVALLLIMSPLTIAVQIEIYRRIIATSRRMTASLDEKYEQVSRAQFQNYRQIESLFSIFSLLKINSPLPPLRDWAVCPDFASLLIAIVRERKPKLILELGSGVSTLVAAYTLKEIGEGTVISLDHDKRFAHAAEDAVRKHGLEDIATVVYSPLAELVVRGQTYLWYETSQLGKLDPIEMLIVDGPPGHLQELSRYPALPVLWKRLGEDALILLDDAARQDEKKIVELWRSEFRELECETANTEKGAVVLRRTKKPPAIISDTQVAPAASGA